MTTICKTSGNSAGLVRKMISQVPLLDRNYTRYLTWRAKSLESAGDKSASRNKHYSAARKYEKAVRILEKLGHRSTEESLSKLYSKAITRYEQVASSDPQRTLAIRVKIAQLYLKLNRPEEAAKAYEEAGEISFIFLKKAGDAFALAGNGADSNRVYVEFAKSVPSEVEQELTDRALKPIVIIPS